MQQLTFYVFSVMMDRYIRSTNRLKACVASCCNAPIKLMPSLGAMSCLRHHVSRDVGYSLALDSRRLTACARGLDQQPVSRKGWLRRRCFCAAQLVSSHESQALCGSVSNLVRKLLAFRSLYQETVKVTIRASRASIQPDTVHQYNSTVPLAAR